LGVGSAAAVSVIGLAFLALTPLPSRPTEIPFAFAMAEISGDVLGGASIVLWLIVYRRTLNRLGRGQLVAIPPGAAYPAALSCIRPLTIDDVQRALVQRRTIVKTWSLRGALHLHPSKELLLVLGGLMPTRLAYHQRWIRGLGLKEEETTALVLKALEDGPLTRNQLTEFLAKRLAAKWEHWTAGGWGRKTEGSSLSWRLVRPAVVRGVVCFG